jgi:predicted ArsR family transcriptional regulator
MKEPTIRISTLLELLKLSRSAPISAKEAADVLNSRDVKIKPILNELEAQGLLMSRKRVRPAVDEMGGLMKGGMPVEYSLSPVWGGKGVQP